MKKKALTTGVSSQDGFYLAESFLKEIIKSKMLGNTNTKPQSEKTSFNLFSPYSISKFFFGKIIEIKKFLQRLS